MPLLKQENPKLSENLSAMAMRLRQDEEALNQIPDLSQGLDIYWVRDLHPAQRSRVLDAFLKHSGVKEPEAAHIAQAEALLFAKSPSAKARFPGGITISRLYDRLTVAKEDTPLEKVFLDCPGTLEIPRLGLKVCCEPASQIVNTANVFTVQPTGKLVLRSRETGDEIRLPGGTKSLKKLFIDKKIPAEERNRVPILADDKGILGVYGIGVHADRQTKELPAVQIRFEVIEAIEKINA
jgi:tRNA(Ile)-lysidine synthase